MEQDIHLSDQLKENIQRLMTLYELQLSQSNELKTKLLQAESELEIRNQKISELQRKYDTLKIAKTIALSGTETHDVKIKINKIVRDIDRCIAMLNT